MFLKKVRTFPQYCVPQKYLSALLGKLASQPSLHQAAIKWFVKHYKVDMSEAKFEDISHYPTFNDFFTRELKPDARPFDVDKNILISPVDGVVSQIGNVEKGKLIQAKGHDYSVEELIASKAGAEPFLNGKFTTLYLSPKDYHRVHMPMDGTLTKMTYIPGKLFAVKPLTAETVPNLFARNERLVMCFETKVGPMVLVMVGAMIVGAIATVWHGIVKRTGSIEQWQYPNDALLDASFKKGQTLGHFQLGSTVILLMPQQTNWLSDITPQTSLRMGQRIMTL